MLADIASHAHVWRPLASWPGRFRCTDTDCRVIGSRAVLPRLVDAEDLPEIQPYRCTRRGCDAEAVINNSRSGQFCKAHK